MCWLGSLEFLPDATPEGSSDLSRCSASWGCRWWKLLLCVCTESGPWPSVLSPYFWTPTSTLWASSHSEVEPAYPGVGLFSATGTLVFLILHNDWGEEHPPQPLLCWEESEPSLWMPWRDNGLLQAEMICNICNSLLTIKAIPTIHQHLIMEGMCLSPGGHFKYCPLPNTWEI